MCISYLHNFLINKMCISYLYIFLINKICIICSFFNVLYIVMAIALLSYHGGDRGEEPPRDLSRVPTDYQPTPSPRSATKFLVFECL